MMPRATATSATLRAMGPPVSKESASGTQFFHDEGVGGWNGAFQQLRAGGRGQIVGAVVVLQNDRNAVDRAADFAGFAFGIEQAGGFERFRIGRNDGVDVRALLV